MSIVFVVTKSPEKRSTAGSYKGSVPLRLMTKPFIFLRNTAEGDCYEK